MLPKARVDNKMNKVFLKVKYPFNGPQDRPCLNYQLTRTLFPQTFILEIQIFQYKNWKVSDTHDSWKGYKIKYQGTTQY